MEANDPRGATRDYGSRTLTARLRALIPALLRHLIARLTAQLAHATYRDRIALTASPHTKVCLRCCKEKPLSEFRRMHSALEGYTPYCKDCRRMAERIFREEM